jgi:hypothetical protein
MDWWENDPSESERVCPCWEKSCCPATFDSFRHMPAHCRQQHPDKLPLGGPHHRARHRGQPAEGAELGGNGPDA